MRYGECDAQSVDSCPSGADYSGSAKKKGVGTDLNVSVHVILDNREGRVAEEVKELDEALGGLEEFARLDTALGGNVGVRLQSAR